MDQENKDIFDSAEVEVTAPAMDIATPDIDESDAGLEDETIVPKSNDLSLEEKEKRDGVHKEMHGKILTIQSAKVMPPRTKGFENGIVVKIPPKVNEETGSKSYDSKLQIRFEEENVVGYYPNVQFWLDNNGKIKPQYNFWREGNSQVSIICRLVLQHMAKTFEGGKYAFKMQKEKINDRDTLVVDKKDEQKFMLMSRKVSDTQILAYLTGKKVRIEVSKGTYKKKTWFRNDIAEILD